MTANNNNGATYSEQRTATAKTILPRRDKRRRDASPVDDLLTILAFCSPQKWQVGYRIFTECRQGFVVCHFCCIVAIRKNEKLLQVVGEISLELLTWSRKVRGRKEGRVDLSFEREELEWKNVAIIIVRAIEADKPPMEDRGWRVGVGLPSLTPQRVIQFG